LTLNALHNIVNAGTISSAGNLSLKAGDSITNSLPANINGATPVLQALNNVNLTAGSGQINNNGIIQSLTGAINVAANSNARLSGGDWLSNELNVSAPNGRVDINAGNVSGQLNISADEAHVSVSAPVLKLGTQCLTGDPTYYNNAVNGDIQINGNITLGANIAIVASRDITTNGDWTITANNGGAGQDISLVAGANITGGGGGDTTNGVPTPGTPATATITVTGASATGGSIKFGSNTMSLLAKASPSSGAPGGNVQLYAYHDSGSGTLGGEVLLSSTSTINTAGEGNGPNGNVQILAGKTSGTALTTGNIIAAGGAGGFGFVQIANGQPNDSYSFDTNGAISLSSNVGIGPPGNVIINGNITSASRISLFAGGNITRQKGLYEMPM
jgi:hypothetical protein